MADFDKFNKFNIYSRRSLSSIQNPLQAPVASGTFDILNSTAGTVYDYDASVIFTGGEADLYEWVGTPPPWATLNTATCRVTGTSTAGTWSGYAIKAVNTKGSATSNTDSVIISEASVSESTLRLNGVDSFLSIASTTLNSGDTVTFELATTEVTTQVIMDGVDLRYNVTKINAASGSLAIDGTPEAFNAEAAEYLDDEYHTWVYTADSTITISRFGSKSGNSNYCPGSFKSISINKGGDITTWAIDSGSITTESPIFDEIGIGDITFNNVVLADWTLDILTPLLSGTFNLADALVGDTVSFDANTLNNGGEATGWALNNPPSGLSVNSSGIVSGAYDTRTTYNNVSLTASNIHGSSTSNSDTVTIYSEADKPQLVGTLDIPDGKVGSIYLIEASTLFTGTVTEYGIIGNFPDGTDIDPSTGRIQGVATLEDDFIDYQVVATNIAGSSSTNLDSCSIAARDPFPTQKIPKRGYNGYPEITCTALTASITLYDTTSEAPCFIQAHAKNTTATGTTRTGAPIKPSTHVEYTWLLLNSNGEVPPNAPVHENPTTGEDVNLYTQQQRCQVIFPINALDPDVYTVICVARLPDGSGGYITSVDSATYTVTALDKNHLWFDSVGGDDANNGYDAWGLVYSGGTYNATTGVVNATGGFTSFTPTVNTYNRVDDDSWLYIDGVCVPVEKVDNDNVTVLEGYRDQVTNTTGLSSVSTNGPIQTTIPNAAVTNTFYHLNGNGGEANFIKAERFGLGTPDIALIGYNGHPNDNGRVRISPNESWSAPSNSIIEPVVFSGDVRIKNIRVDSLGKAPTVVVARQGYQGDRTTEGKIHFDNVYITGSVSTGAGLAWQEPYKTEAKGSLIVYDSINNDVDSKGQINKGNAAYFQLGRGVWFNTTSTVWTGYGGAINNLHVHNLYLAGQPDNTSIYLCETYQASGERRFNYCYNCNSSGGVSYDSVQQPLDHIEIINCSGEDSGYFADFSGSSNNRANDSWFQNARLSGNYARIPDTFTYFNNCSNMTAFDNTAYQESARIQTQGFIQSAGLITDTVTDSDEVVWDHDNDVFVAYNRVINKFFTAPNSNYDGSSYFEYIGNDIYEDDDSITRIDLGQPSDYDSKHTYLNNTLYTLNSKPFYDWDATSNKTFAEYGSLITSAGGEWSGNDQVEPDWQDVDTANFLPVAYASTAPTINIQPTNSAAALGETGIFIIDASRADTIQWQIDTGLGFVDIELGVNSVLVMHDLTSGDLTSSIRCIVSNDFGSTTSNTVSFV